MNIANYEQTSRYPLSTQGLTFIQNQILTAQKMCAALGSGKWIIDGCEEASENGVTVITAGAVVVNKEIVEVSKQAKTAACYIKEVANQSPSRVARSLTFGTSVTGDNMAWADFKRVDISLLATKAEVEALQDLAMPKGAIIMWSGTVNESDAAFPYGFRLCDGRTIAGYGTIPDLRSRFIAGYDPRITDGIATDYNEVGNTGGEDRHSLTVDEMPSHRHSITGEIMQKEGSATKKVVALDAGGDSNLGNRTYPDKIGYTGGGEAFDNRPPYYTLAYIIKII